MCVFKPQVNKLLLRVSVICSQLFFLVIDAAVQLFVMSSSCRLFGFCCWQMFKCNMCCSELVAQICVDVFATIAHLCCEFHTIVLRKDCSNRSRRMIVFAVMCKHMCCIVFCHLEVTEECCFQRCIVAR